MYTPNPPNVVSDPAMGSGIPCRAKWWLQKTKKAPSKRKKSNELCRVMKRSESVAREDIAGRAGIFQKPFCVPAVIFMRQGGHPHGAPPEKTSKRQCVNFAPKLTTFAQRNMN
jgi:hypothetical protein